MRVRTLAGTLLLLVAIGGCSSSAKQTAPPPAVSGSLGLFGSSVANPNGVVAIGAAKQTVPADLAFVVLGLGGEDPFAIGSTIDDSLIGGPPFTIPGPTKAASAAARDKIRAALVALGIQKRAIEFSAPGALSGDPSDGGTLQVEVPVAKLPKIATDVVAAVKKSGQSVSGSGLRFAVLDCVAALSDAREKALDKAHARAETLAKVAGVTLGDLTSVSEQPALASALSYFTGGGNPCGRGEVPDLANPESTISELSAKPEVELNESIVATYALGQSDGRVVAATGLGEKSGPADSADLVISPSPIFDFESPGAPKFDEADVLRALAPLGIAKKAVDVDIPTSLSPLSSITDAAYVSVHVTLAQLKASGTKIVDAVHKVVGADGSAGVIFRSAKCDDLLAQTRAAAFADAGKRLDKLALAAKVKLGAVVGVAQADESLYVPEFDPCEADLDELGGLGLLSGGSGLSGVPGLADLDAEPRVTLQVSLSISREMVS